MSDSNLIKTDPEQESNQQVYTVRGQKIIFGHDLAKVYEMNEAALNEAVKNNPQRFPEDFMFQLSNQEWEQLQSQFDHIVPQPSDNEAPWAFTEKGVAMLSCVLPSARAIGINIQLIQAYTSFDKKRGEDLLAVFAILKKLLVKDKLPPREPIGFKIPKKN